MFETNCNVVINKKEHKALVRDSEVLAIVKRLHKNLGSFDFCKAVDAFFNAAASDNAEDSENAE